MVYPGLSPLLVLVHRVTMVIVSTASTVYSNGGLRDGRFFFPKFILLRAAYPLWLENAGIIVRWENRGTVLFFFEDLLTNVFKIGVQLFSDSVQYSSNMIIILQYNFLSLSLYISIR